MATAKKAPAKKAPAKAAAAPAKKAAAPAKKAAAPVKKAAPAASNKAAAAKKAPAKVAAAPAKKAVAAPKKTAPVKKATAPVKKATAPVKKAVPAVAKKAAAPIAAKKAAKAAPAPVAVAKKAAAPATPTAKAVAAPAAKVVAAPAAKVVAKKPGQPVVPEKAAVKGVTKDGISYTKDFDAKFLTTQRALLLDEKASLTGQAVRLEDEALALITEQEMGDVQFDDEGGEGDTMVVERERDLALSAQARQTIADIEAALGRLLIGTYDYSVESGRPIPRERLEAIPWATVLVEEKIGGIGRR